MANRISHAQQPAVEYRGGGCRLLLAYALPLPLIAFLLVLLLSGCGDTIIQVVTSSTEAAERTTTTLESTTTTVPPFTQAEGEIFLEPAGTAGPESFAGEAFVTVGPTTTLNIPTSTTALPSPPPAPADTDARLQVASYAGDTPALYGGSKSKAVADKEGQLRFLEANPDKAAAFCAALNSDPTLRWSGGNQVRPDQLRDYFEELTPVMLTRDTRVTNHGYRDGRPTPRQSVLQAGQMVLVDRYGVPRVRCECGNPLTPPRAVTRTPRYTGPRWPGFDPTVIIVIQQTTVIIDEFILIDIHTGDTFTRPPGTSGDRDEVREPTAWELTVDLIFRKGDIVRTIQWRAQITANPDGTLSGSGEGVFHIDGFTADDREENRTGTFTADASFTVNISGRIETTELGRVLMIQPALGGYTVESMDFNTTSDVGQLKASINSQLPKWLDAFTELDLQAVAEGPVLASIAAGVYTGNAALVPLR